ncbi:MAG: hypothetical protein QF473_38040 [Planctomycetota bacterium]|nr:hypothetical protein [Planctomycetota bacterium]
MTSAGKLSSTHHSQAEVGAQFDTLDGWQVALRFQDASSEAEAIRSGVGLADVSYIQKLDLKADSCESQVPDNLAPKARPLARRHWLVTSDWNETQRLQVPDTAECSTAGISIIDVSSVYAAFILAGPQSRSVIQKLSSLDVSGAALPNQDTAQASLAQVHCIVIRDDIAGLTSFLLLPGREYGEYAWNTVMDAGKQFGIAPVGLDALRLLRG